uniref:Uncharacterized protein n=1 Tax=uncultured Thiotrichaceae bacterium TaxID=298394 RepID=A0A6S6U257_9GAMM|nr:MAG: Unknown protein [uncultured Thiotrichaceae bacterium]
MKAKCLHKFRQAYGDGIIEGVVWEVPEPVPPSEHPYKYRLVYIINGQRVIGYDNERGKGDHKHLGDDEISYVFQDVATLLADFRNDLEGYES